MGSHGKYMDEAWLACLLLTSCCAAWFLPGHGSGLGDPALNGATGRVKREDVNHTRPLVDSTALQP